MISLTSWMDSIPGDRKLFDINIPGTHDSGSYAELISGTSENIGSRFHCQSLSINQQLNAGVRFIDLRGYAKSDNPDIKIGVCHGDGPLGLDPRFVLSFNDVLDACVIFVRQHPTETIIILVKRDYLDKNDFNRAWNVTYGIHGSLQYPWYTGDQFSPELKDLRGKLFLLVRDDNIDPTCKARVKDWKNLTDEDNIYIQDFYQTNTSELDNKVNQITGCLQKADTSAQLQTSIYSKLVLNYWSAEDSSGVGLLPGVFSPRGDPKSISDYVKPRVANYLDQHPRGRYGVQVIDFIDIDISRKVIMTNRLFCGNNF